MVSKLHTSKYKIELKIAFEIVSTSSWPLGGTPWKFGPMDISKINIKWLWNVYTSMFIQLVFN